MSAGPGNNLGRALTLDKCLGHDKTRAKGAHNGLGWNAHAVIDPLFYWRDIQRPISPSARRTVRQVTRHFARLGDDEAVIAYILPALTRDSNTLVEGRAANSVRT